jgi:Arc/MetJ-type ribon-helix-helix transcriptional regulator
MKVSVSLPEEDVAFLDSYAQSQGIESRSAVVHRAVGLLRASELGDAYEDAFTSWSDDEEGSAWEPVTGDGLEA